MSAPLPAKPVMLVADNGPLGALAIADRLDCLLELGIPLRITDMVIEEATRNNRLWWTETVRDWLDRNRGRYERVETATGRDYLRQLALWETAGRPRGLEPATADKGDRSIQDVIEEYEGRMDPGETLVALVDERRLRKRLARAEVNVEIISTRGLFKIIESDLHRGDALAMWRIVMVSNPSMDPIDETLVVRNVRREDDVPAPKSSPPPWKR